MDRDSAVDYLSQQFDQFEGEANMTPTDDAAGYGEVITNALLKLGVPFSTISPYTVEDGRVEDYRALLDYYALVKFTRKLGTAVSQNVSDSGISDKVGSLYTQAVQLREDAKALVISLGYTVAGAPTVPAVTVGEIRLDIFEPGSSDEWS